MREQRLPAPGRAVQQHAARRVDADLLVEVEVGEGQLDCLTNLLFLHVQATDVGVRHIRLLIGSQHGDGRVGLRGQDVDEGIGVAVEGNG